MRAEERRLKNKEQNSIARRAWRIAPVLFFLFILRSVMVYADTQDSFHRANTYYSDGKYDEAVKAYEEALEEGLESGNLYYNLGNSFFKKGELGRAILNYEKALRLIPRDSDLRSNYEYARSLIKGSAVEVRPCWYRAVFRGVFSLWTIDELAVWLMVIFTLILAVVLAGSCIPAFRKHRLVILPVPAVVFIFSLIALLEKTALPAREAIITVEKTDARFEPFDSATAHFTLYEGSKAVIISSNGSWRKVERADKKRGWVKSSDLEIF